MRAKSVRRLDGQGRVILPAHIRKALNLAQDSAVSIDMTRDGAIMIRPVDKRCCVCGEGVEGHPHITIDSWSGPKYICALCDERGEWEE